VRLLSRFVLVIVLALPLASTLASTALAAPPPAPVVTANPDPAHPILSAAFQAETDARSASRLTGGNRLTLLENGVRSTPVKRALAATARSTLFVTTMNWRHDASGRGFADDLIAARRRGVDVRAIVDAAFASPLIVARLRAGGVRVVRFNGVFTPGADRKGRLHWKMVIADLDRGVLGGMNIGDDFWQGDGANGYFHDADALLEGAAAVEAARAFLDLWRDLQPRDLTAVALLADPRFAAPAVQAGAPGAARVITHEPDLGRFRLTDYYVRCIRAARTQVLWHVNVFEPVEPLYGELIAAAARGVRVVIVLNSGEAFRPRFPLPYVPYFKLEALFARLAFMGTGVEVYELDQPIHSKAFTVDGVLASVGSYNFNRTSVRLNLECSAIGYEAAFVRSVEEMFDRDMARARRVL